MKKIITLLILTALILTALIPVQLLAADDDVPIKVSFEEYNYNIKEFTDNLSKTTKLLGELFLKKLGKEGRKIVIADSKGEADFRVFFIRQSFYKPEGQPNYIPHDVPTLPENKHYVINTIPYRFNSQWMGGELYQKGNKIVGGNIMIQFAYYMRLKELYYILEGKWNKIPMKAEEQTHPVEMFYNIEEEYEEATKKYKAREKRLDGKPWETPSKEEVDKMFSKKGETALMVAQLMRITPPRIHASMWSNQFNKCMEQSKGFYSKLHAHLFDKILEQAADNANSNIMHDITPSEEIFQEIHNASGDYNCFITNSKLTEFSR